MSRFKVEHLKPTGTIEHTMTGIVLAPDVDPHPVVLVLRHTGKANERFHKQFKNAQTRGKTDSRTLASIFARTVVADWKHVYDDSGKPVTFSPNDAESLFEELIDADREPDLIEAFNKASDLNRFAGRDELGKG